MKHLHLKVLLFLVVCCCTNLGKLFAQPMYQSIFPLTTGNNAFPLNSSSSNKAQFLYLPSEIAPSTAAGGLISKIYLLVGSNTTNPVTYTNLAVDIGTTTQAATTATFVTGLQSCYFEPSVTIPGHVAGSWFEIDLQTPFAWDGVSNLVIEVKQNGYSPSAGIGVRQYTGNGNRRTYGLYANPTGTGNTGQVGLGFDMLPGITGFNNAGIAELISPILFCPGTKEVKVKVRNSGSNALNSLQVQWTMNGVAQPPVNITTPIDTFGSVLGNELEVSLGNYTFTTAPVTLKAWSTLPNGGVDTINNNDTLNSTLNPSIFTLNASQDTICANAVANLTLSPGTGYPASAVTWQSSTNGTIWNTIAGANGPSYAATGLATATSYRAAVNLGGTSCSTNTANIEVFNVVSPVGTGAERCGDGAVTLSATVAGPGVLKWYENAIGGPPVGTGASFTTPILNATTDYYVTAGDGATADSIAIPLATGTTTGVYHHMFLVSSPTGTTISEIALKINNAVGTSTAWDVYYRPDNYQTVPGANTSNVGWTLLSSTTNIASLGASNYTTIAENLSLAVPAGATYSLYIAPVTGTHQYYSPAIGTVTATTTTMEIKAGNRGSALFNCTTSGGQAVVKIKTLAGCESPRIPVTAIVNSLPDLNLGNDLDTCTFAAIPMTLDPGAQPAGSTFVWDNNSTASTRAVSQNGTYHVTVTNSHGCISSDTITINMREKPAIDLEASETSFCHGATAVLDAGAGGQNGGEYYWNNGAQTQTIEVNAAGTYIVIVTSADGCVNSDTVDIIIDGYAPTSDGIHVLALSSDSFTFSAINPQNIANYEWDFGDGSPTSISANPTHQFHSNGQFLVKMRSISSCADAFDSAYVNIIGLDIKNQNLDANLIHLYPNPNKSGILNVELTQGIKVENITIFNVLGQQIPLNLTLPQINQNFSIMLPDHLPNGIYQMVIHTDKGATTKKIEIRR